MSLPARLFVPGLGPVLVAGLTGGIASGKSTVAGMMRELGTPVVDADEIVHEMLSPGGAAVGPIVAAFGAAAQTLDGAVDRVALAALVFRNDEAREQLEEIVHPLVAAAARDRLADAAEATRAEVVVYDAALLVETGRRDEVDRLVVVSAPPDVQLARLMARDHIDADAAGARLRAQLPLERKLDVADYVIDNGGRWDQTRRQVAATMAALREDAALLRMGQPLPRRR
ncbi:MAG TPA: dephospho-CoA kinase [Acidobacteriota bacterium]|nr:dephospho-CoA kinase [Acidobacteriota bacterium]